MAEIISSGQEDDQRTRFQRARLSELRKYCDSKGIEIKGNARKDEILMIIMAQGDVSIGDVMPVVAMKAVKAANYESDLSKGRPKKDKKAMKTA